MEIQGYYWNALYDTQRTRPFEPILEYRYLSWSIGFGLYFMYISLNTMPSSRLPNWPYTCFENNLASSL